jgi:hypothetical protein
VANNIAGETADPNVAGVFGQNTGQAGVGIPTCFRCMGQFGHINRDLSLCITASRAFARKPRADLFGERKEYHDAKSNRGSFSSR